MITITVGDIIRHSMPDEYFQASYCIYIVRDGPKVLYVDQAARQTTQERWLQHLAAGIDSDRHSATRGPSELGRYVLENAPQSHSWQIDLLTLADCQRWVTSGRHQLTVGEAERLLIKRYSPLVNRANNSKRPVQPAQPLRRRGQALALPEFSTEYLAAVSDNQSTQDTYRYALQRFQKFAEATELALTLKPLQPSCFYGDVLVDFVTWLRNDGARNNTIRTFVSIVKQYLTWLEGRVGGVNRRQVEDMELALEKSAGPHMRSIPHEHRKADRAVGRLLNHFADKLKAPLPNTRRGRKQKLGYLRNHAILQTLYSTAGRASEVATLLRAPVDSIHFEPISITGGRSRQPLPIEIVGKGGRARPIFLTPEALDAIRAYLAARDALDTSNGDQIVTDRSAALFVRHDRNSARPISTKTIWQIVSCAAKEVFGLDAKGRPIKRYGPRDFRHLRAQDLFDNGMPIDTLQALLGHSSMLTTKRTYADQPSQERLSIALEQFGRDANEVASR
jgi:site-specific recombinase XerD